MSVCVRLRGERASECMCVCVRVCFIVVQTSSNDLCHDSHWGRRLFTCSCRRLLLKPDRDFEKEPRRRWIHLKNVEAPRREKASLPR